MTSYKKNGLLDEIEIKDISHEEIVSTLSKIVKKQKVSKKSFAKLSLQEKIEYIKENINKILGRYKGFIKVITDEDELREYIDKAIKIDYLAFDTETNNSLDPLTCELMGLCMYIPNTKPVYVPLNHRIPGTDTLLENQVSMNVARECLAKIKENNTKLVYHNGKFDMRVIYNVFGFYLPIYWDTMIASQLLNENDQAKLKVQYPKHVDPTVSHYNIEGIFMGVPYAWIDPETFALYAAIDAYDTHKLREFQKKEFEKEGMERLYNLFKTVEMPVVEVTAQMEDQGVCIDNDFLSKLHSKYTREAEKAKRDFEKLLEPYNKDMLKYQALGKLDNPFNINSDSQLNTIFYDILKIPRVEGMKKSTEKDVLEAMDNEYADKILDYRQYNTLIKMFTEPLPSWLSEKDGKLHAHFNQMGTEEKGIRTGRFSSTEPNLQQIPSKEKTFRLMFQASEEYNDIEVVDNSLIADNYVDIETIRGWKRIKDIIKDDIILASEEKKYKVISTEEKEDKIKLALESVEVM